MMLPILLKKALENHSKYQYLYSQKALNLDIRSMYTTINKKFSLSFAEAAYSAFCPRSRVD